jgi:pyridoxal phosphate enzyme (YggS family)
MNLTERYRSVLTNIEQAAKSAGRDKSSVNLIVVSKNHPASLVSELVSLGQRAFGENRDQEASKKAAELKLSAVEVDWHFVGQLQTNKVKSVLDYASTIHSIDRPSLVSELTKQLQKQEKRIDGFIELNLTDDPARGGVAPSDLLSLAEQVLSSERINLLGVMAVAGLGKDPEAEFERALGMSAQLQTLAPAANRLSMGMSEDYEIAIKLGATHIRVGSAITGPRPISA